MARIHERTINKDLNDPYNHNGVITHLELDVIHDTSIFSSKSLYDLPHLFTFCLINLPFYFLTSEQKFFGQWTSIQFYYVEYGSIILFNLYILIICQNNKSKMSRNSYKRVKLKAFSL